MNTVRTRLVLVSVLALAVLSVAGCSSRTSIADINRDPGRFSGKEISIKGQASSAFGGLGTGVFQLDDGTGRIWVLSENLGVPGNGASVTVTGRVEQGISVGGRTLGVLVRQTQRRN